MTWLALFGALSRLLALSEALRAAEWLPPRLCGLAISAALPLPGVSSMLLGANPNSLLTVDLSGGLVAQYLGTTRGLAFGLFVFCLAVALLVEAFGQSPAAPRDFGGVVFRAALVLVLLTFYSKLFGSLFGLAEGIANRVAPHDVWGQFTNAQTKWMNDVARDAGDSTLKSLPGWGAGYVFDALVAAALLLGQASLWVVNTFGRVLAALLYVVGPLPLVFSIPRGVGTGGRWFRVFASVLCWPTLSGLMVSLTVAFGLQSSQTGQGASVAFESVALAALMAVISLAVPLIASSLVGAGFDSIGTGWQALATAGPAVDAAVSGGRLAAAASVAGAGKAQQVAMRGVHAAAPVVRRGARAARVAMAGAWQRFGAARSAVAEPPAPLAPRPPGNPPAPPKAPGGAS